ncbi:mitochondrial fission ELM1 family protein [Siccirubricoccus phaeus]|uniref:mitochondrial fission ELM1 family protein n=1 Tax=Siccirubricoccus phaeus TaxID=2595053 RepID=UPI00165C2221|nr:ELM1/GtrOC1 family putative glycosyltransferase [Siccirubricoccus phaeus]
MSTPDRPPRIWALLGPRTGDNNQVLALAEALGEPVRPVPLRYNLLRLLPNRFGDTGRLSLAPASRPLLAPPWPDLVIGAGQRSVPVARWIRARSGGHTRIVQIGRPRCDPARLDLVVTTPQYGVPPGPTVLEAPLSLTRQTPEVLAAAALAWRDRLEGFPSPRRALVLGGDSWPWRLRRTEVEAACRMLFARAQAEGGSVLAIGSRRTPAAVADAVRAALAAAPVPSAFLEGTGEHSPYAGLLALADEILVTADSVAMISDAVATGKPVGLVPVHAAGLGGAWLRLMRGLRRADASAPAAGLLPRAAGRAWGALVRRGLAGWPRDLWFLWRAMERHGLAGSVGAPVRGNPPAVAEAAAAWVRRLLPPVPAGGGRDAARPGTAHRGGYGAP